MFVVGDGDAVQVRAGDGRRSGGAASSSLAGPAGGTRVVSSPPPELTDGMKIKEKGN